MLNLFFTSTETQNNGVVLLPKAISLHQNCLQSPVVMDGEDGNGLKLETSSQSVLKILKKISWFSLTAKFHLISSS